MNKIEFNCSACNSLLRVDKDHAGKKARCPKCNMIHDVPGSPPSYDVPGSPPSHSGSVGGVGSSGATGGFSGHSYDMPTHIQGGNWELRTADGQVYGPVEKPELDDWAGEGRVSANCYLRQHDGEWFPAEQIYPAVSGATPTTDQPHYVGDESAGSAGFGQTYANPYSDRPAGGYAPAHQHPHSQLRPHNGATILTLGLLGLLCCCVFGIVAWVMGAKDLAAMKNGTMDPSGRGLVTAGYVLGIVSVLLHGIVILLSCIGEGVRM